MAPLAGSRVASSLSAAGQGRHASQVASARTLGVILAADHTIYRSERIAEAYARSRPPIHGAICRRILGPVLPQSGVARALDVGCGAGASTAALLQYSAKVVGVDPYLPMLAQAEAQVRGVSFFQGSFQSLPFEPGSFDLVATAGAINYSDVAAALMEVHRVLQPGGWFLAYDFSAGRRLTIDSPLPTLYAQFRQRYPSSPGYELDLAALPLAAAGLALAAEQDFVVDTPLSAEQYVQYLLGDSGVERAIADGASEELVQDYCAGLFRGVFGGQAQRVVFEVQAVLARRPLSAARDDA